MSPREPFDSAMRSTDAGTMTIESCTARLDGLPVGQFHYRVITVLVIAFFFEVGDQATIGIVAPALQQHLGFGLDSIAAATSTTYLGLLLGAAAGGWLGDRFGRRPVLLGGVAVMSLGPLLSAAALDPPTLIALRGFTGLGMGAAFILVAVYLAEVLPRDGEAASRRSPSPLRAPAW